MTRERYLTVAAWGVHLFTASGAVAGLLACDRIAANDFRGAFILMAIAIVIDSADGTLARLVKVRGRIPFFDGALLDNIVDYFNYVAVPLFLMLRAGLLPRNALGFFAASLAILASAYGFSRDDAKTADHYFLGFPSYWNLVALYLFCRSRPDGLLAGEIYLPEPHRTDAPGHARLRGAMGTCHTRVDPGFAHPQSDSALHVPRLRRLLLRNVLRSLRASAAARRPQLHLTPWIRSRNPPHPPTGLS
jgi:phosphatidylglycerophosphate synthase